MPPCIGYVCPMPVKEKVWRGASAHGFQMAKELGFPSVRIDTHPGNLPMQRALAKAGFVPCGEIHLVGGCEDGNLRIAFEKVL